VQRQMWKRLHLLGHKETHFFREKVLISSSGEKETKEVDELVKRWQSGEPMERFGGAYDEERMQIIRVIGVSPGERHRTLSRALNE
jgi:hypothetical protein